MWLVLFFGVMSNDFQGRVDRIEQQQTELAQARHAAEHRRMLYDLWGIRTGPTVTPIAIRSGPRNSATEIGAWDR